MDNNVIEKFVISMYSRNMSVEEIADTVKIPEWKVGKIIDNHKREISERKQRIENAESDRPYSMLKKGRRVEKQKKPKKPKKEELPKVQVDKPVTKTVANLQEIKLKIMRGEEYDKEKLKKLRSRIIIKNYRIPNSEEVRELAQIYVQLSKFTAAKAIVREIYNEAMKKANSDKIMSEIIKQELSYNIMKYYRMGLSASQMAEELKLYTVDVIREINRQKELNVKIKEMHQEGKSEVDIADLLHENIERVKWGVESKQKDKPKLYGDGKNNKSEAEGDER